MIPIWLLSFIKARSHSTARNFSVLVDIRPNARSERDRQALHPSRRLCNNSFFCSQFRRIEVVPITQATGTCARWGTSCQPQILPNIVWPSRSSQPALHRAIVAGMRLIFRPAPLHNPPALFRWPAFFKATSFREVLARSRSPGSCACSNSACETK